MSPSKADKRPGPPCKVCSNDCLETIEKLHSQGTSMRRIARVFGASISGVRRHMSVCLPRRGLPHTKPQKSQYFTDRTGSGRTCSICQRSDIELINTLVVNGRSIRDIAGQIGRPSLKTSLHRHIKNCLRCEIRTLFKKKKISNAIDVLSAFGNLMDEADEYYYAARDILEVNGELDFNPRAWEVIVVYDDYSDCRDDGSPKQKRDLLSKLLAKLAGVGISSTESLINTSDPRADLRLAYVQCQRILDRIAKFFVLPTKELHIEDELQGIRDMIRRVAVKMGTDYKSELLLFLDDCRERLRPDLWAALVAESIE